MTHMHNKAVIIASLQDLEALSNVLPTVPNSAQIPHSAENFADKWFRDSTGIVVYFEYFEDRLHWYYSHNFNNEGQFTLLPLQAVISPSDYPEYYI